MSNKVMDEERKIYITKKGLEEIKKEYKFLKSLRLAETKSEAPKLLESEDLNPDYISFQENLNLLELRISEIENILKNAVLIKTPSKGTEKEIVGLGAKVTLEIDGAEKDEFTIVGSLEANPSLGKISNDSPVGKALFGHKIGDEVVVSSPIKTIYKIKKIKYS